VVAVVVIVVVAIVIIAVLVVAAAVVVVVALVIIAVVVVVIVVYNLINVCTTTIPVRLTTLPPSCAVVTKSGSLNILEPSGLSRPVMGPLYFTLLLFMCKAIAVKLNKEH